MKIGWKDEFIRSLAEKGNVTRAATAAQVSRPYVYEQREADTDFAAQWDDALEQAADHLEGEARRRAVEGVDEPVFFQGEACGTVRKYSDSLLTLLLKAAKPEKYRERQDMTTGGKVLNRNLAEAIANLDGLTEEQVIQLHYESLGSAGKNRA